jgi:ORF 12 gene product N-terminal
MDCAMRTGFLGRRPGRPGYGRSCVPAAPEGRLRNAGVSMRTVNTHPSRGRASLPLGKPTTLAPARNTSARCWYMRKMPARPGSHRSGRRGRSAWSIMAALRDGAFRRRVQLAGGADADGSAPSTEPATAVVPPDTPAGHQLEWLIGALAHLPIPDVDLRTHFNPGYLATASPAALNQWLQAQTGAKLVSIKVDQPSMVVAIVSDGGAGPRTRVGLTVDSRGLIGDLSNQPGHHRTGAGHMDRCRCRFRLGWPPAACRQREQRLVSAPCTASTPTTPRRSARC